MTVEGTILRLQVQKGSLKAGEAPARWYNPAPISSVPSLSMSVDGVWGHDDSAAPIVDVHNATHSESKNRNRTNGVSIGFTSHYRAMRERFGDHLEDGLAGENILIHTDEMVGPEHLAEGLVIRNEAGYEVRLTDIIVAAPCVEFARFALRFPNGAKPDRTVTDAVKFLNNGMRGYYAKVSVSTSGRISVGDTAVGK